MIRFKLSVLLSCTLQLFITIGVLPVFCQSNTINLINYSRSSYNPAVTGIYDQYELFLSGRSDRYFKQNLARASLFVPAFNAGAALYVESYQSLLETRASICLNLAYRLNINKGFWQFGLAPVFHHLKLNNDNLKIRNPDDPFTPQQNISSWMIHYNAGALLKYKDFLVSVSIQNLAAPFTKDDLSSLFANPAGFAGWISYNRKLGDFWQYTPSLYYYKEYRTSFAAISNQLFYRSAFIGFQYGSYAAWSASVGFSQKELSQFGKLHAGYTFSSRPLGITRSLVHEIFINIGLGKSIQNKEQETLKNPPDYTSPVFF